MIDGRGNAIPAASVTVYDSGDPDRVWLQYDCEPHLSADGELRLCPVGINRGSDPTRIVATSPGFIDFDEIVEYDGESFMADPVVLQDDPMPTALCEADCGRQLECELTDTSSTECTSGCLMQLALTGDDLADKCRPPRAALVSCTGSRLTCSDYGDYLAGGAEHPCARFVQALDACEG